MAYNFEELCIHTTFGRETSEQIKEYVLIHIYDLEERLSRSIYKKWINKIFWQQENNLEPVAAEQIFIIIIHLRFSGK